MRRGKKRWSDRELVRLALLCAITERDSSAESQESDGSAEGRNYAARDRALSAAFRDLLQRRYGQEHPHDTIGRGMRPVSMFALIDCEPRDFKAEIPAPRRLG